LAIDGPPWVRAANDFATVTLPERDCDAIRDLLIAERPGTVIEIGLAYGSSALAIGEALISVGGNRHVILDPFQDSGFRDAGREVIRSAQLDGVATLLRERSQIALPRLAAEGMSADAAFVDGSHVFHNVFVDLYYLQMIVRPGGWLFSTIIGGQGSLRRLAISRPIWAGDRKRLRTARRDNYVRCGCPIRR
jgi:cephalosporin hydroxylase